MPHGRDTRRTDAGRSSAAGASRTPDVAQSSWSLGLYRMGRGCSPVRFARRVLPVTRVPLARHGGAAAADPALAACRGDGRR